MSDKSKLGFKKDIRLEWMNHSLYLTLQGLSEKEIRKELDEYLTSQFTESGKPFSKGSINLIKPLLAIWFKENPVNKDFRDSLIHEAASCDSSDWLPFHWALMAVEYPLWYHVADQFGRLFSLQDIVTPAQIYSRIKDIYGDTETVARNSRYIIATMAQWGIIEKKDEKNGKYQKPQKKQISNIAISLVCEGILRVKNVAISEETLLHEQCLFPFDFDISSLSLIAQYTGNRVVIMQQGIGKSILTISTNISR